MRIHEMPPATCDLDLVYRLFVLFSAQNSQIDVLVTDGSCPASALSAGRSSASGPLCAVLLLLLCRVESSRYLQAALPQPAT